MAAKQASLTDYRLSKLTDRERQVYNAVNSGKDPEEVAPSIGVKATTARTLLWRARGKLGERPGGRRLATKKTASRRKSW